MLCSSRETQARHRRDRVGPGVVPGIHPHQPAELERNPAGIRVGDLPPAPRDHPLGHRRRSGVCGAGPAPACPGRSGRELGFRPGSSRPVRPSGSLLRGSAPAGSKVSLSSSGRDLLLEDPGPRALRRPAGACPADDLPGPGNTADGPGDRRRGGRFRGPGRHAALRGRHPARRGGIRTGVRRGLSGAPAGEVPGGLLVVQAAPGRQRGVPGRGGGPGQVPAVERTARDGRLRGVLLLHELQRGPGRGGIPFSGLLRKGSGVHQSRPRPHRGHPDQ